MSETGFYRAFEDQHRGSREVIKQRLASAYLPFIEAVRTVYPQAGAVDVGCGRGEWLELLRDNGIAGRGVDLDEGMLAACRAIGLDAVHGDAVQFLRALPEASQAIVSGFHIAEHLPFDVLHALVREAHRVLLPGGMLILETPNAENLLVATSGFYMDPTHERPLPWQLMEFMARYHGFARTCLLRLQEPPQLAERESLTLQDVLGGASPDYAIVAQKQAPAEHAAVLEGPMHVERGLSLDTLAQRYDGKLKSDIHEANSSVLQAVQEVRAARQHADEVIHALHVRVAGVEHAAHARFVELQHQLASVHAQHAAVHAQLVAVYGSTSWRMTAPVRKASSLARRSLQLTKRGVLAGARLVHMDQALLRAWRKLRPLPPQAPPEEAAAPAAEQPSTVLSPAERQVQEQLERAAASDAKRD